MVGGLAIGGVTALLVFAITLVRTTMHMAKMMYVTATTNVCFNRQYLDSLLRVAVFLLVPIPHLLWLVEMQKQLHALEDDAPIVPRNVATLTDAQHAFGICVPIMDSNPLSTGTDATIARLVEFPKLK